MLKFRPTTYNEGDFRAFKYTGSADITEGMICHATAADLHKTHIRVFTGTTTTAAAGTLTSDALKYAAKSKQLFPVYRENPDPENVTATISSGDFVIGFFGQEFEIHKDATESGYATTFTMNGLVCCGSNGKWAMSSGKNSTMYVLAECIGTFNAKWIRLRSLVN